MNYFPDGGTQKAETRGTVNNKQLCYSPLVRECGNSRRQVSRATKFCSSPVWNMLPVTLLAPKLLRRLSTFLADVCTPALVYADSVLLVITRSKCTVRLTNTKPKKPNLRRNPPETWCNHLNCRPQNDTQMTCATYSQKHFSPSETCYHRKDGFGSECNKLTP